MIIDFHAHIGRGMNTANALQRDISPAKILNYADEAGVDKTVIFPVTSDDYSRANRDIYEAVQSHPGRLIGFCRVAPENPDAMKHLETAVHSYGLQGLKLHPGCDSMKLEGDPVARLIQYCGELKIPVIFDCAPRPGRVEGLTRLAERCPQTIIVMAHMGMGGFWNLAALEQCVLAAERLPNVYLDTAMVDLLPILEDAIRRVPGKILLGSDSPAMHPAVNIEMIRVLHLPGDVENRVLGGNAAGLLTCLSHDLIQVRNAG